MVWLGVIALAVGFVCVQSQSCGVPKRVPATGNYETEDRIVGGRIANAHSWPWVVSLITSAGHNCGGSLINDQWVLTAAHCIAGRSPYGVAIKLGEHSLRARDAGETVIQSSKFIIHPSYSQFGTANDIALIKMVKKVTFSDTIQPVCLPTAGATLAEGVLTYVTGWGSTGLTTSSDKLKQTAVPVVDWNRCRRMHPRPVSPGSICTGYSSGGHNPCFGDSGGPLVVSNGKTWVQHGVVSWGPQICAIKEEPAVFTKVSAYISWINNVLRLQ